MKQLLFFLLIPFLLPAQVLEKQFVATVQYNGFTQINDSLYRGDLIEFRDVLIEGYQPSGVDSGFICLDGTGRAYRVEVVNSFDYSSLNVDLIELDDYDEIPIGVGIVAERYGSTYQIPNGLVNSIGISAVLQAKILNHNTKIAATTVQPPDTLYLKEASGVTAISDGDTIDVSPYLFKSDTSAMLTRYIERGDTSLMLTNYVTFGNLSGYPTGTGTADRLARWTGTNTLGAGSWSDNLTRLQAQVPVQFQSVTTAGLPTGVTGYTVYNTTINGPGWYNGTRWAYALESTFARGTATRVPFFDANGQITDNANVNYDGNGLFVGGVPFTDPIVGQTVRIGAVSSANKIWLQPNFSFGPISGVTDGTATGIAFLDKSASPTRYATGAYSNHNYELRANNTARATLYGTLATDALGVSGQASIAFPNNTSTSFISVSVNNTFPYIGVTNGTVRAYAVQANATEGAAFGSFSNHIITLKTNNIAKLEVGTNGTLTQKNTTTGLFLGGGTTAQTPTEVLGLIRANSDSSLYQIYSSGARAYIATRLYARTLVNNAKNLGNFDLVQTANRFYSAANFNMRFDSAKDFRILFNSNNSELYNYSFDPQLTYTRLQHRKTGATTFVLASGSIVPTGYVPVAFEMTDVDNTNSMTFKLDRTVTGVYSGFYLERNDGAGATVVFAEKNDRSFQIGVNNSMPKFLVATTLSSASTDAEPVYVIPGVGVTTTKNPGIHLQTYRGGNTIRDLFAMTQGDTAVFRLDNSGKAWFYNNLLVGKDSIVRIKTKGLVKNPGSSAFSNVFLGGGAVELRQQVSSFQPIISMELDSNRNRSFLKIGKYNGNSVNILSASDGSDFTGGMVFESQLRKDTSSTAGFSFTFAKIDASNNTSQPVNADNIRFAPYTAFQVAGQQANGNWYWGSDKGTVISPSGDSIFHNGKLRLQGLGTGTAVTLLGKTSSNEIVPVYAKRDTTIFVTADTDYDFSAAVTTAQISRRYNRIIIHMTLTSGASADKTTTLHTPDANLMQCEILIRGTDNTGTYDNEIAFGTNNAISSDGTNTSGYTLAQGQGLHVRVVYNGSAYKYIYY